MKEVSEEDELDGKVLRCSFTSDGWCLWRDGRTDRPPQQARGEGFGELDETEDDKVGEQELGRVLVGLGGLAVEDIESEVRWRKEGEEVGSWASEVEEVERDEKNKSSDGHVSTAEQPPFGAHKSPVPTTRKSLSKPVFFSNSRTVGDLPKVFLRLPACFCAASLADCTAGSSST